MKAHKPSVVSPPETVPKHEPTRFTSRFLGRSVGTRLFDRPDQSISNRTQPA